MLLVGHFSSKQGFCPSEFPVLENLRRVILESQGPDPGSVQAHLYQFVTIQQNRNFNISRLEPVACLFLWSFIRLSSSLLQWSLALWDQALMKLYSSIPGSIPSEKFTMFVFLVTRCIKLSAEGANNIYRDAASEWDTEMQSSFNNIGSLALTPKIRSGSPSLLEIDSSWWESWHDLTLQWAQYCNNSNHDDDDMVAANCCYLPSAWFHTSVNLWMEQLPLGIQGCT